MDKEEVVLYDSSHYFKRRLIGAFVYLLISIYLLIWIFYIVILSKMWDLGGHQGSFNYWLYGALIVSFSFPLLSIWTFYKFKEMRPFRILPHGVSKIEVPFSIGIKNEDIIIPFESIINVELKRPEDGKYWHWGSVPSWWIIIEYKETDGPVEKMTITPSHGEEPERIVDLLNEGMEQ